MSEARKVGGVGDAHHQRRDPAGGHDELGVVELSTTATAK